MGPYSWSQTEKLGPAVVKVGTGVNNGTVDRHSWQTERRGMERKWSRVQQAGKSCYIEIKTNGELNSRANNLASVGGFR